jgi:hypothetical protein
LLQKLALGGWLETKQNLIIEGPDRSWEIVARLRAWT